MTESSHDNAPGSSSQGGQARDENKSLSRSTHIHTSKALSEEEALQWKESQKLRSARLLSRDTTHEICGACQRIRHNNAFSHHDYEDLIKSTILGCDPCRIILNGVKGTIKEADPNPALHVEVDRYNEQFRVRAKGPSRSVYFDIFVLSFGSDNDMRQSTYRNETSTEPGGGERSEITEAEMPFLYPTLHRKIPPKIDSLRSYQQIHRWLNNCLRNHPRCRENAKQQGGSSGVYPTRLLEITRDTVRLLDNQQKALAAHPPYVALSYCWGLGQALTTTVATLASNTRGIARESLPQTIQDAASVCFRLSIKFLWVDALCVLQDSPEDWAAECMRMGDYYSSATLTISALESSSVHDGFLNRRSQLPPARLFRSIWDPQGYGGHPEIWVRQSSEPHGMVMLRAPLSQRGWALQERVLSTRIVHFAPTELLWECLTHSATEGSTEIHEHKQDCSKITHSGGSDFKRALFTPNSIDHYSIIDGAFAIWQRFVMEYSGRKLTHPGDRMPAIAGLAAVIGEQTNSPYCAGIFVQDIAELAWRRHKSWSAVPAVSRPAPAPAPSWSWAQPNWRVEFPFYDEERAASALDARFLSFDATVKHGSLAIRALFRRLSADSASAKIRIAQRVHKTKTHMIPGPHRLKGCTCDKEVEEIRVYHLVITPDDSAPGYWKRTGTASRRFVVGCTGEQPSDDFRFPAWETIRLV